MLYAFDGTNDDGRGSGTDAAAMGGQTNVWKFYSAYEGYIPNGSVINVYEPGVGTRFGPVGTVVGGAFGAGWLHRIVNAYEKLCDNYVQDHKEAKHIDVVGFSRGSALALDFVNKVSSDGIRQDG